jgi:hypothetical protein
MQSGINAGLIFSRLGGDVHTSVADAKQYSSNKRPHGKAYLK